MLPYSVAGERCVTKLAYRGSDASSSSFAISVLPVSRALGLAIWLLDSVLPTLTANNNNNHHDSSSGTTGATAAASESASPSSPPVLASASSSASAASGTLVRGEAIMGTNNSRIFSIIGLNSVAHDKTFSGRVSLVKEKLKLCLAALLFWHPIDEWHIATARRGVGSVGIGRRRG